MQVDFDSAVDAFEHLFDSSLQSPYLHPRYVVADAARDTALSPVFFVFEESGHAYYYAFHTSPVPGQAIRDIQSPYGYGGPISDTDDEVFLERASADFLRWCRKNSILAEFVRFHPLLDNNKFFTGEVLKDRDVVWIDLGKEDLLSTYSTRARTTIRKAQKNGLEVEWREPENFAPMFPGFYLNHMQSLNADSYYFFPESYFRQLFSWNQAQLAACTLNGEMLGAAIFLRGPHHMEYHLSASTELGRQLGATNLMIHAATLRGRELGCAKFNLGGGTSAAQDNPLLFFKSGFSQQKAPFSIGRRIHLPDRYNELKADWEKIHERPASRVLFYR